MSENNIRSFYEKQGGELPEYIGRPEESAAEINEIARHSAGDFVAERREAVADDDGELHALDWCILNTGDPLLIGDHPLIRRAFTENIPGRVIGLVWITLGIKESAVLSKHCNRLVATEYEVHVQFFRDQEKPFVFWKPFLTKVKTRPYSAIVLD